MFLTLKILGGLLAFLLGVWFGLPGRYAQTSQDIEELMARGPGRRRRVRRHFRGIEWLQRRLSTRGSRRASGGRSRGFRMELPDDR